MSLPTSTPMNRRHWLLLPALAALLLLGASGPGVRLGLWDYRTGFDLLRWAVYAGLFAAGTALVSLAIPALRRRQVAALVVAAVAGLGTAWLPWHWYQQGRAVPAIHDISTDLADAPAFVAVVPLRAGAANPPTYGGAEVASEQRRAYPDIRPLDLAVPPSEAFARALAAAHETGWDIVAADGAAGRIEATATTPWFGFKDDVVVRIVPTATGSRVDVRSLSRVGKSDLGTNARRVRAYLAKLSGSP